MKNDRILPRVAPLACVSLATALLTFAPHQILAQAAARNWQLAGELGGVVGGTWMRGSNVPTVTTAPGVVLGLNGQRTVSPHASVGAAIRIGAQPLSLTEHDTKWTGGTLSEGNALGVVSLFGARDQPLTVSVDLGLGIAVLSGARSILPFRDASSVSPLGELGVSLRHSTTRSKPAGDAQAVFVRYSMLRLDASATETIATTGWVGRLTAGVRITK